MARLNNVSVFGNLTAHISVLPVVSNKKNRKVVANEAHQKIYKALEQFK